MRLYAFLLHSFFLLLYSSSSESLLYSEDCERVTRKAQDKERGMLIFKPDKPWDLAFAIDTGGEDIDPFVTTNYTGEIVRYNDLLTSACRQNKIMLPDEEIPSWHSEITDNPKQSWQFKEETDFYMWPSGRMMGVTEETEMAVGPMQLERFCVDVEYAMPPPDEHEKLRQQAITVEALNSKSLPVAKFNFPFKPGFSTVRLADRIPDDVASNVTLVLRVKNANLLGFRKLYGCNPYAQEVRTVVEKNAKEFPPKDPELEKVCLNGRGRIDNDGHCSCIDGYSGYRCETVARNEIGPFIQHDPSANKVSGSSTVECENGGWKDDRGRCSCPVGFGGPTCQTACGARKWGPDCDRYCSDTSLGCRAIVFCQHPYTSCQCATGFTGYTCNEPCNSTRWGPNCRHEYGKCLWDEGDPYTGTCLKGCQPGYVLPRCTDKYVHMTSPPKVEVSYTSAKIVSILSNNTRGYGRPTYFVVQHKEDADDWDKASNAVVKAVSPKEVAAYTLRDLLPGTAYSARTTLFTDDMKSYLDNNLPYATFRTLCKLTAQLSLSVVVIKDTAALMWKREKGRWKESEECPMTKFEVQVRGKSKWVSTTVDNPEKTVMPLTPGLEYAARVRQMNPHATGLFSNTVHFSYTQNNGLVQNLEVVSVNSTSAVVVWDELDITERNFTVFWNCMGVMSSTKGASCLDDASWSHVTDRSTNYTITGLKPFRSYILRVRHNPGLLYNQLIFTTKPSVPEEAPDLMGLDFEFDKRSIVVSWPKPDQCLKCNGVILGFKYRLTDSKNSVKLEGYVETSEGEPTVRLPSERLEPNSGYQLRVFLANIEGFNPDYPMIVNFTTPSAGPRRITVKRVTEENAIIVWEPPMFSTANITSYLLHLKESKQGGDVLFRTQLQANVSVESAEDKSYYSTRVAGLRPGTKYSVDVAAVTGTNESRSTSQIFCTRPPSTWLASFALPKALPISSPLRLQDVVWRQPPGQVTGKNQRPDNTTSWTIRSTLLILYVVNESSPFVLDDMYVRSEDPKCTRKFQDEYLEQLLDREFGPTYYILSAFKKVGKELEQEELDPDLVVDNCGKPKEQDDLSAMAFVEVRDHCGLLNAAIVKTEPFISDYDP